MSFKKLDALKIEVVELEELKLEQVQELGLSLSIYLWCAQSKVQGPEVAIPRTGLRAIDWPLGGGMRSIANTGMAMLIPRESSVRGRECGEYRGGRMRDTQPHSPIGLLMRVPRRGNRR